MLTQLPFQIAHNQVKIPLCLTFMLQASWVKGFTAIMLLRITRRLPLREQCILINHTLLNWNANACVREDPPLVAKRKSKNKNEINFFVARLHTNKIASVRQSHGPFYDFHANIKSKCVGDYILFGKNFFFSLFFSIPGTRPQSMQNTVTRSVTQLNQNLKSWLHHACLHPLPLFRPTSPPLCPFVSTVILLPQLSCIDTGVTFLSQHLFLHLVFHL